jgi:hypothetical protein
MPQSCYDTDQAFGSYGARTRHEDAVRPDFGRTRR